MRFTPFPAKPEHFMEFITKLGRYALAGMDSIPAPLRGGLAFRVGLWLLAIQQSYAGSIESVREGRGGDDLFPEPN